MSRSENTVRTEVIAWVGLASIAIAGTAWMASRYVLERTTGTDAALRSMPLDDAYIHLVYARALAEEGGFHYNPGQAETGATSPLWAALLSLLFALKRGGIDLPTVETVKALCASLSALQAFAGGLLTRRLTGSMAAAFVTVVLLVAEPMLVFASVSGMELALAGGLSLFSVHALVRGRLSAAACGLGLASLVRPELALASLLVPLAWGSERLARGGDAPSEGRPRPSLGSYAAQAALVAGPFLLWIVVCLRTTGNPLPNTFYAKHRPGTWLEHLSDLPLTLEALRIDVPTVASGLGLLPFALGIGVIARRPLPHGAWLARGLALLPLVLFGGLVWAHDLAEPTSFYWERYWLIVVPFLVVWVVVGLHAIVERSKAFGSAAPRALARTAVAIYGAWVLACAVPLLTEKARLYAWNCENIREAHVTIGRWLARHVPPDRAIATTDGGAVRFYSHRRTIDLGGLNYHRLLDGDVRSVMQRERPLAFVVFPRQLATIGQIPDLATVLEIRSRNFTICNCAQDPMAVLVPRNELARLVTPP